MTDDDLFHLTARLQDLPFGYLEKALNASPAEDQEAVLRVARRAQAITEISRRERDRFYEQTGADE